MNESGQHDSKHMLMSVQHSLTSQVPGVMLYRGLYVPLCSADDDSGSSQIILRQIVLEVIQSEVHSSECRTGVGSVTMFYTSFVTLKIYSYFT